MPSNIFCLDLGTKTGWALKTSEDKITSGVQNFAPKRFEGGGMRFLKFSQWLNCSLDTNAPNLIYFEEVRRHLGVNAAHAYGGFLAHLTSWAETHKIPYESVPVGTIKRFITGKGNASKEQVMHYVEKMGYHPIDDNEADALALLAWAINENLTK